MGKDENNTRLKEKITGRSTEMDVPHMTERNRSESGPIIPVSSHVGVEDEDKIIFGAIENDLYVVEEDDPRPKRVVLGNPPDLKSSRETYLDSTENESYITQPLREQKPGPLHPGKSKKHSVDTWED